MALAKLLTTVYVCLSVSEWNASVPFLVARPLYFWQTLRAASWVVSPFVCTDRSGSELSPLHYDGLGLTGCSEHPEEWSCEKLPQRRASGAMRCCRGRCYISIGALRCGHCLGSVVAAERRRHAACSEAGFVDISAVAVNTCIASPPVELCHRRRRRQL